MRLVTTTQLAEKANVDRSVLFDRLNQLGWIRRVNNRWSLTDIGKAQGGESRTSASKGTFVVWPENLEVETILKRQLLDITNNSNLEPEEDVSSEGEDYLAEYFDEIGIEYEEQYLLESLADEFHNFRVADFYLPKYKVVVEFAGRWNRSKQERERYITKRAVYKKNNVACIWIYPDNLGIIHFIFHNRLEQAMKDNGLKKELVKYRLGELWKIDQDNFYGIGIGLFCLFYIATPWQDNRGWFWFSLGVVVYNVYRITRDVLTVSKGKSVEVSRLTKWED
jgi:hypothetical protein